MSEPQKNRNPATSSESPKLDSTSAAAALALAVASAEKAGEKPSKTEPAKTTADAWKSLPSLPAEWRTHGARAAAVALAIGLGWAGGSQALSGGKQAMPVVPEWIDAAISGVRHNQEDLVRLTGDVRVLKSIVEAMKESFDQAKVEAAGQQSALLERVDGIERAAQETTAKIAHVLEASGRIERASTDAGAKLFALPARLDDIERQAKAAAASAAVKSAAAAAVADGPAQTGSVPEPNVAAKDIPLEGWVLRDVHAGVALVESRGGRLHEVVPGMKLPNVGRVEAIERRGRTWVVVTAKGIIGAPDRWQ